MSDERIAWFVRKVEEITFDLNKKIWRFDITGLGTIVILRYDEGDGFPQHVNLAAAYGDHKIGVFIQLSPPEAYEGGVLNAMALLRRARRPAGEVRCWPFPPGCPIT